ncbi:MAG: methionine synthase [Acidothermaceae bacterium]
MPEFTRSPVGAESSNGPEPSTGAAVSTAAERPWGVGAATGVGSMPGTDPDEAMRVVVGELEAFPHLVELPASGIGADMIGRGAAHLLELHTELTVSGWRFAAHAGADERRSRAALARDLDVLEEHVQGFAGPLKIQCAGPWSIASSVELRYGDKALADAGAVRDIAAALAEGLAAVAADVQRRVPGAHIVVQVDEPSLPAVLAGRVRTASGFGALAAVEFSDAVEKLRRVAAAVSAVGATPIAHCCADGVPVGLFVDAGMHAIGLDATLLDDNGSRTDDEIGAAIEHGVAFFLGLIASTDPDPAEKPVRAQEIAAPARRLWSRLGFAPENLARDVIVTPTCGLAHASHSWPARAYRSCTEVARVLLEEPEEARSEKENR